MNSLITDRLIAINKENIAVRKGWKQLTPDEVEATNLPIPKLDAGAVPELTVFYQVDKNDPANIVMVMRDEHGKRIHTYNLRNEAIKEREVRMETQSGERRRS